VSTLIRATGAVVALGLLGSIPLALAQTNRLHKVDLKLDVTWAGKRGIQIPIRPGSTETLKGPCPPVVEMNTKFDPSEPIPVEARYQLSDGRTIERKQTTFMGGLYTEEWNVPIQNDGQSFKGSVTLHITSPASDQNDVTVPFSVACDSKATAPTCDTSGNSCHAGVQLGAPVIAGLSPDAPPMAWSGGTLLPGTYVLTAAKQYTFKGTTTTADTTPSQMTAVIKKVGAGESAELVGTQGSCMTRSIVSVTHNPKVIPGALVPAYEPVFNGPHAVTLAVTCPPSDGSIGLPAAYSVTPGGFTVMLLTGTALTFVRKP
jgi:hypothetical protein